VGHASSDKKARRRAAQATRTPVPPVEAEDSQRFVANPGVGEAQNAPCLAAAVVPPAVEIADDPAQWQVAGGALIRALGFDRLQTGHPAASALPAALAPVAGTECRNEELAVLSRALDGTIPGVAGSVVADALMHNANPLDVLVASGAVRPSEVLGAGGRILDALVNLFETDAELRRRRVA